MSYCTKRMEKIEYTGEGKFCSGHVACAGRVEALSLVSERNEDILYVCFDNEGYMNTGGQKSASTPRNAVTGSTPLGKTTRKKNQIEFLATHRIPYAATVSPSHLNDMATKIEKSKAIKGTIVIIVLIPCLPGWGVDVTSFPISRTGQSLASFNSHTSRVGTMHGNVDGFG